MTPSPPAHNAIPTPRPRIVGWHLDRDPSRPCDGCRLKPSIVLVDYGDGCPTEACENCRPANAADEIAEIFAQAVGEGLQHPAN